MAKKTRFPLIMENGEKVRSVQELRDNFSILRVIGYLQEGKLLTWLCDRYADDIAAKIEELDLQDVDLARRISEIFDVPFDEDAQEELAEAAERAERILKLKEYTDDEKYEVLIDRVAFDQDELYDRLDEGKTELYLCGEQFSIPLAKQNISYTGINHPIVVIDSKVQVDWNKKGIILKNIEFDEKYKKIIETVEDAGSGGETAHVDNRHDMHPLRAYCEKSYTYALMDQSQRKRAKELFRFIGVHMMDFPVDLDSDTVALNKLIKQSGIVGMADRFIEQL